ncbi:MAG: hypothetical protein FWC56_01525, partial [Phycisphaerae bacterium]|nr:hypothetical protein [Phycisphaerae bacterium]
ETIELQAKTLPSWDSSGQQDKVIRSMGASVQTLMWIKQTDQYISEVTGTDIKGDQFRKSFERLVEKEPKYKSDIPFRGVVQLGDHSYPYVLDSSDLKTQGLDRLYFDANRNGDLTDDAVCEAVPQKSESKALPEGYTIFRRFLPLEVEIKVGGTHYKANIEFESTTSMNVMTMVKLTNITYREGILTIAGKPHQIFLFDRNCNGRFDDVCEMERPSGSRVSPRFFGDIFRLRRLGDLVCVDPTLSKDASYYDRIPSARPERQSLSRLLNIDDHYYDVQITPAGDRMTVEPTKSPMGSIVNPSGRYRATIASDEHGVLDIVGDKNQPVPIPAGEWQLISYTLYANDVASTQPASQPTHSSASRPNTGGQARPVLPPSVMGSGTNKAEPIIVEPGKTELFPFGPPYRLVVVLHVLQGRTVSLQPVLIGMGHEKVFNNSKWHTDPKFKILNEAGEIIEQGSSKELGGQYSWKLPEKLEDKYRVQVELDSAGPFEIDCSQESILKKADLEEQLKRQSR